MILSVADAKTYMKIADDETAWDAFIEDLILEAQNETETYCGQKFEQSVRTYIFDGNGASEWIIGTLPVAGSPAATLHYRDTPFGSWTAIDASDVTTLKSNGVTSLYYNGTLIEGRQNYKCTATVGYVSGEVSAEVSAVLKEMTQVKFQESPHGAALLAKSSTARTIDGASATESYVDMRPKWQRRMRAYRRVPV